MLGAFYLRLTGTDIDVYRYLEPLYNDYRKVRQKLPDGGNFCVCCIHSSFKTESGTCFRMENLVSDPHSAIVFFLLNFHQPSV